MTFTRALSTNNYGPAKFIVDGTTTANGTHSTIATALTSATSGDTIFIRSGTYTENPTLKAGVNLVSFGSESSQNATGQVIISGTCTLTTAGSVTISGIQLQTNSAVLLAVTGSAASIVNLDNCYLNCTNATGITFSSSSSSARINIKSCKGNLGTTGIALFAHSSAGVLGMTDSDFTNSGSSLTASTCSAGTFTHVRCSFSSSYTSSGTASTNGSWSSVAPNTLNITAVTEGGSGGTNYYYCIFLSGTASAISISNTTTLNSALIGSSNTNAITGAGTVNYSDVNFISTSNTMNTTTQAARVSRPGITRSAHQPAFLALAGTQDNVTGDGTTYTLTFATEIYDQNSNWDGTSTFTAPYSGVYSFFCALGYTGLTASHTAAGANFIASNRTIRAFIGNPQVIRSGTNTVGFNHVCNVDMDAADTLTFQLQVSNGTKVVDIDATYIGGYLIC